jgi:hypothetical protein
MFIAIGAMMAIEDLSNRYLLLLGVQLVILAYVLWYLVASLRTCYSEGWGKSALKALGVLLLFLPALGVSIEQVSQWGQGNADPLLRLIKD